MGRFRRKPRYFLRYRLARFMALALLTPFVARGQSSAPPSSATVHGVVRDSHGLPVQAASVHLQLRGTNQIITVPTDANGTYLCSGLREGAYTVRAEKAGNGDATFGPINLEDKQVREIDLSLAPAPTPQHQAQTGGAPEFFDEPQFTVAGITDTMSHGGHGSDTVSRTTQSLAKDIVTLDKGSPAAPHSGSQTAAEQALREAAAQNPTSWEANQRLGLLLAHSGQSQEAILYLERAHHISPEVYENGKALAQAYADLGRYDDARSTARTLLAKYDKADLHHLLADVDEKERNPLDAVHEYQRAAELEPTEPNLFDWGSELLTHRALEPAVEVFTKGNRLFPHSTRMLVGLGVAWYATGSPSEAAKYVCQASDLSPADPNPYLVLGKMQIVDPAQSDAVSTKMERFVRLHPENALAHYYYAVSLWKRHQRSDSPDPSLQVQSLLETAVKLDPKLAVGFLQMGVLQQEQADFPHAILAFQKTIAIDSQLAEAHYRLAQAYRRTGEPRKAEDEIKLYNQISKKTAEQAEQEAREIPQFVYTLRDPRSPGRSQ